MNILAQATDPSFVNWLQAGGAALLGGLVVKLVQMFNTRGMEKDKLEAEGNKNLIASLTKQLDDEKENLKKLREEFDNFRKSTEEKMDIKIEQFTEAVAKAASAEASNAELRNQIETLQDEKKKLEKQLSDCRGD